MTRSVLGCLSLGLLLSPALIQAQTAEPTPAQAAKKIKMSECTVYSNSSTGTFIAVCGSEQYFGTAKRVVQVTPGESTQVTAQGVTVKYTKATSDGKQGLLLYCTGKYTFYAPADDATWAKFPQGKDTEVLVCPAKGGENCADLAFPCGEAPKLSTGTPTPTPMPAPTTAKPATAPAKTNGSTEKPAKDPKIIQTGGQNPNVAAAPGVTLIENEQVKPDEAMVFTRSTLIEEGDAVASMHEFQENIDTVRYNINTYRIGYALPATKVGERFIFSGAVKGWRATSTGDTSAWPVVTYPVSRKETMRRAKLLKPVLQAEPIDEMNNLRVYYYPILVGHDGKQYEVEDSALAFCIHPKTGYRMTVMLRGGRTYGAVNAPLATTSQIYVKEAYPYKTGFLNIGTARVPSVFYSKHVKFDMEPFAAGDNFDGLMANVLNANDGPPLSSEDFRALYQEMLRYTGGKVE